MYIFVSTAKQSHVPFTSLDVYLILQMWIRLLAHAH